MDVYFILKYTFVYFKWVNFIVYKLYLNEAVKKSIMGLAMIFTYDTKSTILNRNNW